MALTDSLVSYWKLDESSGNASDSVGSNTLTNNGTIPFVTGKINNGADLENTTPNDYFTSNGASLGITGNISISMWVNFETAPVNNGNPICLVERFSSPTSKGYQFLYKKEDPGAAFRLQAEYVDDSGNQTRAMSGNAAFDLGTGSWKHLVFTVTVATQVIKAYVNGTEYTLSNEITASSSIGVSTNDFTLGRSTHFADWYFDGILDEVGIWNRVLTSTEVTELYNGGAGLQYPFGAAAENTSNFFMFMDRR